VRRDESWGTKVGEILTYSSSAVQGREVASKVKKWRGEPEKSNKRRKNSGLRKEEKGVARFVFLCKTGETEICSSKGNFSYKKTKKGGLRKVSNAGAGELESGDIRC